MPWQQKTLNDEPAATTTVQDERPGAKNRPTPKRRDQEAARKQPLVVTDRKAARDRDKEKRREALARQRQAMVTGDDAHLPPRDKGPERRFIRDYVDARWSVGEIVLPIMVIVLALSFLRTSWALMTVFFLTYGLIAVAIVDAVLMWRRIKARLIAKFGAGHVPQGATMYAVMRAFQLRPTRMPKPQVKRGDYPT
ncbi:MAG TPA: DUF3043 domain-containing protein [Ornithinibacter sp.]|nr:DUF3043 domain-containing protein [Lapillicoccus sp.]HEU5241866.1 DUF3043 domain-containing protein [Ornithinibacter sp.]